MKDTRLRRLGRWRLERMLGRDLSGTYFAGGRDDGLRGTLYVPLAGIARRPLAPLVDAHQRLARAELVRFYDLGHDDGAPFVIGEPVDDGLAALRSGIRPTPGQTAQIGLAVSSALIAAHDVDVFHGGLELDNVLWAPGLRVRVLGAGAAVLDIADPDVLARGDVVSLGRLICALIAGRRDDEDADRLREVAQQLADPSTGMTMRTAHALLVAEAPRQDDAPGLSGEHTAPRAPALSFDDSDVPTVDGPGWSPAGSAAEWRCGPIDGRGLPPADHGHGPTAPLLGGDALRRLGRYRILARLGRGGMGEVLLAEDPTLRRGVAIKRIRPGLEHDPMFRARLRREAQLAARLCHRAIVQVFDLITSDGVDHVVMEYVSGPSLHALLGGTPMVAAEVVRIAIELADGLAYAHQQNVLHRDLKLENVLLDACGQPKIADFGIARQLTGDGREPLTASGALVGTLRAMSPEQLLGQDADTRSDLFSFGVLIYELLTGVSPFASTSDAETIHRIVYHRQSRAGDLVSAIPRALSDLVDQILEKAPWERPSSARAIADRLRALASVPREPGEPGEPGEPVTQPLPRGQPLAAGLPVTDAATGSGDHASWLPEAPPPALRRPQLSSRIQAPFVLAEIRALQSSIFRRAPEVQSALAVASRLEHDYDLRRSDLFIPALETFCAVLAPLSTTVLTGTLRRIGYEIFPQYMSILGIPAADIKASLRLRSGTDLVRLICDAYNKCVVGTDAGSLSARITGTIATVTDTTFMPCQLQMGVFLGAGKLTGLYCDSVLTEKRCRLRGDAACVYELAF